MSEESAVRLTYSEDTLKYPDGSINSEVLENLLCEASERNIDLKQQIIVTNHRRIKSFKRMEAKWSKSRSWSRDDLYENVEFSLPLVRLFEMYKKIRGKDYEKSDYMPSLEERFKLKGFRGID